MRDTFEEDLKQGAEKEKQAAADFKELRESKTKEIKPGDHELTLIEREQLAWLEQETGQELTHRMSRRNLLTEGVDLNALVGVRFRIGEVEVEGLRLCEPCKTLQEQTGLDILPAMVGRSGLNCRVLTEGVIRLDDPVG